MKNFVLIGAAGYIAPRHMKAIKETGNNLVAALDPHDAVGMLDQYFPDCDFFTEFERFDRHCEKLKRQGTPVDYVVVCSPNYLHDAHIRFGLRIGADVICEKPVVLNPWNLEALMEMEKETGRHVYVLHQLRYHPAILALREKVSNDPPEKNYKVELEYITPRGNWYTYSWKGDNQKSGGIIANIGLHFFDMLLWIFGEVKEMKLEENTARTASGSLLLEKASVQWILSIDKERLHTIRQGSVVSSFRSLVIDDNNVDFSNGFEELHTETYKAILQGAGT
ncbi:MAG TPA: Gfo/Idh/MocA family oxidoreductase, partial [Chitinophagaceae bacterium]|nr:Gfo/Idh/MocA family oxidoreductase [Chitinophagaceae bacterium]